MKEFALLLLLLQMCSGKVCHTNDEGPIKNTPCVFPFIFNLQTYHSCTDIGDDNGKLWCATLVDQSGNHVRGNWGYCNLNGKH